MNLENFAVSEDNISVIYNDEYLDLHNNYDFIGHQYNVSKRSIVLNWVKGKGDWVNENDPNQVNLVFTDVYLFKSKERDNEIPFKDDCVSNIGFLWNDLIEQMEGYTTHEPKNECNHLNIEFESGMALKVGAKSSHLDLVKIA